MTSVHNMQLKNVTFSTLMALAQLANTHNKKTLIVFFNINLSQKTRFKKIKANVVFIIQYAMCFVYL